MHGLINKAIEGFVRDTYGETLWNEVVEVAGLESPSFEPMLHYETGVTLHLLAHLGLRLKRRPFEILEDLGTYLVSHPNTASLRRLLRFGGVDFADFLHSLDDLPDRARLAVSDLELPHIELGVIDHERFTLTCTANDENGVIPGFGYVLMGVLRGMADDYGALVMLEHDGVTGKRECIEISVIETAFSEGRQFDLAAGRN